MKSAQEPGAICSAHLSDVTSNVNRFRFTYAAHVSLLAAMICTRGDLRGNLRIPDLRMPVVGVGRKGGVGASGERWNGDRGNRTRGEKRTGIGMFGTKLLKDRGEEVDAYACVGYKRKRRRHHDVSSWGGTWCSLDSHRA